MRSKIQHPARYQFTVPFEVRDYECDLQGIVNNAVYLHYLEHARHLFLRQHHLSFAQLSQQGVNLVVIRSEVDYKTPLRSGDRFVVGLTPTRISNVRFGFLQGIARLPGEQVVLQAHIICAAMNRSGRPMMPDVVERLFHHA